MSNDSQSRHAPLRDDVRILGEILGDVLRERVGPDLFERVEQIRQLSVESRASGKVDGDALAALLADLDPPTLLAVARAFSQFLNLANIAEQQHRQRLWRQHQAFAEEDGSEASLGRTLDGLLANGCSPQALLGALETLSVELVLTAHPTEVTRRTLIRKYDRIADLLARQDMSVLTDEERQLWQEEIRRHVLAAWCTDEIRRERPTPVDEAKWGFATVEQSLWYAVPRLRRHLDRVCCEHLGEPLKGGQGMIRFASWMGGDRDGNPNVTAAVTREVLLLSRWMAADLYLRDVENLLADLSMQAASEALRERVGDSHEPYRVILRDVRQRLTATRARMETLLAGGTSDDQDWFASSDELREPLLLIDESLRSCGLQAIADGDLRDTLVRLDAFGISLLSLDIRQESSRHAAAIDAVTQYLGLGSYLEWDEKRRQQFLVAELAGKRPLVDGRFFRSVFCDEPVREVFDTCAVIAEQAPESMGAYVISMARAPSDVLAVYLLQREAGVESPMRVVPLFETLADLENAADSMRALLEVDWYRERISQGQEVMIGYSDSAKDAGFLGPAWAQFRAQESLTALFREYGIALALFHGRGGSVSRGGSPTRKALLSQPPGSVAGRIRVTEQGEVIRFKYGLPGVAEQNLELYVAATLEATVAPPPQPAPHWRAEMEALTAASVASYRAVVQQDPRLVNYLRTVTPENELTRLALGSRPARRRAEGGVESLRAIPWVFAWTQVRLMLPAWLGTDTALQEALREGSRCERLADMQASWPFFQGILDMMEMVLAKADPAITAWYEQHLTDDPDLHQLGDNLRERLRATIDAVKRVADTDDLLSDNPTMKWSIRVRDPYTDPLHLLQAELMSRLRNQASGDMSLESALMVTIAGIAAGMRNTG